MAFSGLAKKDASQKPQCAEDGSPSSKIALIES
jgi:hypothetical protein